MTSAASPVVSVVIPTFNRVDLLPSTIESVLAQTFGDLEVLVVDDGSTDGTGDYVTSLTDPRVRYLRNEWSGLPAVNRNTGIRAARGEFIAFLDSDDLWLPEKLEKQVGFLRTNPGQSWCFCRHDIFHHETGLTSPGPVYEETLTTPFAAHRLLYRCFIGSPTPLVRRNLLAQTGLFNEAPELRFSEDWEFWLRLAAVQPGGFLPEALALYRVHPANSIKSTGIGQERARFMATIKTAVAQNPAVYGTHAQAAMRQMYLWLIKREIVDGRLREARALCTQAAVEAPYTPGLLALRILAALSAVLLAPLLRIRRQVQSLRNR